MAQIKKDTSLRKAILQAAVTGRLISEVKEQGGESLPLAPNVPFSATPSPRGIAPKTPQTGRQLLDRIIAERNKNLLAEWKEALKINPKAKKPAPVAASKIDENEIPFEIPENWCWCRQDDIASISTGMTPLKSEIKFYKDGKIPWITSSLTNKEYIETAESFITDYALENTSLILYPKNTLILAMYGQGKTRGQISELSISATINQACAAIELFINDEYLRKYIKLFHNWNYENIRKDSFGSAQPNLNLGKVQSTLIPLPPLAVQNAIVAKLEQVLPLVDAYENALLQKEELKGALKDKMKKAILQEAVQGKLVPQIAGEGNAKDLLAEIKKNRTDLQISTKSAGKKSAAKKELPPITEEEIPFEIPENWCWCRLSDFCNLYTGNSINETEKKTKYTNLKDGRFYIGTKDVGFDNIINYDNGIKIPFDNDKFRIANANTILMCIEGGSAGRKIAFTDKAVCFGNKLCCFDAYVKETIQFLYYFMQSALFTDLFKDNMNGIIGGVSVNTLKTMLIPLPPLAEQKRIVAAVEELLPLCEKL